MRLIDLHPTWLGRIEHVDGRYSWYHDRLRREAQGIMFGCPKCAPGEHMIICWNPDVPDDLSPLPGRWDLVGDNFVTLSLVGRGTSNSVLLTSGCQAHFFVTDGEIKDG